MTHRATQEDGIRATKKYLPKTETEMRMVSFRYSWNKMAAAYKTSDLWTMLHWK